MTSLHSPTCNAGLNIVLGRGVGKGEGTGKSKANQAENLEVGDPAARLHVSGLLVESVLPTKRGSVDFGADDARCWLTTPEVNPTCTRGLRGTANGERVRFP
jgi:hypothetical protein